MKNVFHFIVQRQLSAHRVVPIHYSNILGQILNEMIQD